jgi:hypothetical protein
VLKRKSGHNDYRGTGGWFSWWKCWFCIVGSRTRTECSWFTLKRLPLYWTEWRVRVVSAWRWLGQFVLVALTRHECSRSQLARARSFLMRFSLFRWLDPLTVVLGLPVSYTLLASRTQPNAARRCYAPRWLARRQDSRRLALRVKLLCGRFPQYNIKKRTVLSL